MSGPVEASASARRGVDSVTVAVLLLAVMPFTTDWMPQASAEEEAAERAAIGWSTAELGQGSLALTVSNTGKVVAQLVAAVASAVLIPGQVPTGPLQLVGAVPVPIRDEAMPEAVILGPYAGELVFGPDLVSAEDVGALARTFKKRRRKQRLETQWYCAYCKNYTSKEETTCRVCEVPKASAVAH